VEDIRFPNRESHIGQLINSYLSSASNLSDQTIHLLFSANRWEQARDIEEKLKAGTTLVCDRYAYSGVAYSSAKGLDKSWCKSGDVGLPRPDCIVFMNMPVEEATKRGQYGEERYEKIDFQRVIQQKFLELKEDDRVSAGGEEQEWFEVDATQSIEDIHEQIKVRVAAVIEGVKDKPIGALWTTKAFDSTK
jgi:dTMP kinase